MARKGEQAQIYSRKQYDYFLKQALSTMSKTDKHHRTVTRGGKPVARANPLDSRGQAHRAGRDDSGKVVQPGGGKADPPPSAQNALQTIMAFHQAGGTRNSLPKASPTKNAARKDQEHATMRRDKVIRPALRPPGSAEYERGIRKQQRAHLTSSKKYLSKSINENFTSALNHALGL